MGDKGLLQRVLLRRDRNKARWTYTVHDTIGTWDGDLGGLSLDTPFPAVVECLSNQIVEHWHQHFGWTFVLTERDRWAAGPDVDGSTPGVGLAPEAEPDHQKFKFRFPKESPVSST